MLETNTTTSLSIQAAAEIAAKLRQQIGTAIFGQDDLVTDSLCCLIGGGHILMTGAPGLAKTTLVRVLSASLGLHAGRVQFTPDLLPSDILGTEILNVDEKGRRSFEFSKGPIFTNLLLADEINRASPRTQSALLEAMQERSVTIGGKRYTLPQPFLVFATQNPYESEGTFPLPEAQLDRFLLHTIVDYPSQADELKILESHSSSRLVGERLELGKSDFVVTSEMLHGLVERAKSIRVEQSMLSLIADIVRMTRPNDLKCPPQYRNAIWYGAGPRAGIALISVCRAMAMLSQSEVVRWSHVRRFAKPVLRHRIKLSSAAVRDGVTEDVFIDGILDQIQTEKGNQGLGLDSN